MKTATSGTWEGHDPVRKDQPGCGWSRRVGVGGAAVVPVKSLKDGGGKGGSRSRPVAECRGDLISLNKENISQGQRKLVYMMEITIVKSGGELCPGKLGCIGSAGGVAETRLGKPGRCAAAPTQLPRGRGTGNSPLLPDQTVVNPNFFNQYRAK
jgi:hypothetical protein